MSLAAREQQILDGMETALQAGETRLTSMFAIFTRLSRDEEIPGMEELAAVPAAAELAEGAAGRGPVSRNARRRSVRAGPVGDGKAGQRSCARSR
jgi:hypothetical protein